MIKNENYPSVNKLKYIDDILGTCIKDFIQEVSYAFYFLRFCLQESAFENQRS